MPVVEEFSACCWRKLGSEKNLRSGQALNNRYNAMMIVVRTSAGELARYSTVLKLRQRASFAAVTILVRWQSFSTHRTCHLGASSDNSSRYGHQESREDTEG